MRRREYNREQDRPGPFPEHPGGHLPALQDTPDRADPLKGALAGDVIRRLLWVSGGPEQSGGLSFSVCVPVPDSRLILSEACGHGPAGNTVPFRLHGFPVCRPGNASAVSCCPLISSGSFRASAFPVRAEAFYNTKNSAVIVRPPCTFIPATGDFYQDPFRIDRSAEFQRAALLVWHNEEWALA